MPPTALIIAARHDDAASISALITAGADVNAVALVEPSGVLRAHEAPVYSSTALFEACRARSLDAISRLLAHPPLDPNVRCTALGLTPFADACARGDAAVAALLLADARVDVAAACAIASHPALLAAAHGCVELLHVLAERGVLAPSLEGALLRTAIANGRTDSHRFLAGHFVGANSSPALRVERFFTLRHRDCASYCDKAELRALLTWLDVRLAEHEFEEACAALNTSGDGRMHIREVIAWLSTAAAA